MEVRKAQLSDAYALSEVAIKAFIPAHRDSCPPQDLHSYMASNFNQKKLEEEMTNSNNTYYVLLDKESIIGYYKINLNLTSTFISSSNVTYMSRLYVLPEYYDKGLGHKLLVHAIEICKKNKQSGMWLKVWTGNDRAIRFYKKQGFEIRGEDGFKISETHSNPNYVMHLPF